ncbi:hypothetical protein OsJ_11100 [Oryza sativa Japonica Group]|uniref:Uncharacterized protein n=1 Tax=Oryza sativa subsp. japonica TaxID=39947 RepID=A3AIM6_ORYSJ|nr:hypothetical protein OsJ_11100 [Oryza sativa Japonica Group]
MTTTTLPLPHRCPPPPRLSGPTTITGNGGGDTIPTRESATVREWERERDLADDRRGNEPALGSQWWMATAATMETERLDAVEAVVRGEEVADGGATIKAEVDGEDDGEGNEGEEEERRARAQEHHRRTEFLWRGASTTLSPARPCRLPSAEMTPTVPTTWGLPVEHFGNEWKAVASFHETMTTMN